MRKIAVTVFAAAAGLGLSQAASAADLDKAPVYTKAAPVATFTWTGSYVGLYVGGATGAGNLTTSVPTTAAGAPLIGTAPASYKLGSSFIGGYTTGYNWQVAPSWVVGYESESGYIKLKGATSFGAAGIPGNTIATTRMESTYDVWSGRVGYAVDRSLFYAKGGVALARFETGVTDPVGGQHVDTTGHKFELGYAVGGGWEYAFAPKWSVKAEYLYLGFSNGLTTTGNSNAAGQVFNTTNLSGIHTGKVGVNYKWDLWSLLR
jgi:outer membrane immunogenic protein